MSAVPVSALHTRLQLALRALDDPPSAPGWNHAELKDLIDATALAPAAVLVPLIDRGGDVQLLFTRRTEGLSQHGGQVSFPGGRIESDDANAIAAALRETREETGIDGALIHPIGFLDSYETISGFCVTPVAAWIDVDYRTQPDPREVAEIFEVPLAFFLDPANLRKFRIDFRGQKREVFEFVHSDQRIWGATAAMLMNFVHRLEKVT
jgi:8-oxo-dGTP pyrophosphatase MutT (NUDIX family)